MSELETLGDAYIIAKELLQMLRLRITQLNHKKTTGSYKVGTLMRLRLNQFCRLQKIEPIYTVNCPSFVIIELINTFQMNAIDSLFQQEPLSVKVDKSIFCAKAALLLRFANACRL